MIRDVDITKTDPRDVARAVVTGIDQAEEEIFPDPMSTDAHTVWRADPKTLERRFSAL